MTRSIGCIWRVAVLLQRVGNSPAYEWWQRRWARHRVRFSLGRYRSTGRLVNVTTVMCASRTKMIVRAGGGGDKFCAFRGQLKSKSFYKSGFGRLDDGETLLCFFSAVTLQKQYKKKTIFFFHLSLRIFRKQWKQQTFAIQTKLFTIG